jgi:hypothetical protein
MRKAAIVLLLSLALVPAAGSSSGTSITPAAAKAADAKIGEAIAKEREALAHVGTTAVLPHVYLYQSIDALQAARTAIKGEDGAAPIVHDITEAIYEDHTGIDHQGDKSHAKILDAIRKALAWKKKAQGALSDYLVGGGSEKTCDSEKPFPLYAVPATYSGSTADVYPHNVPKDAKDLQIKFVDAATGKPAPEHPFPGESWTAKIVGFETRGGEPVLHVHIDITGTGIGKPNEKFVNWKVIVTWAC